MDSPTKYITLVEYGDPNSHQPLVTSFGLFDSYEEADEFRIDTYQDGNFIINIYPISLLDKTNTHE